MVSHGTASPVEHAESVFAGRPECDRLAEPPHRVPPHPTSHKFLGWQDEAAVYAAASAVVGRADGFQVRSQSPGKAAPASSTFWEALPDFQIPLGSG